MRSKEKPQKTEVTKPAADKNAGVEKSLAAKSSDIMTFDTKQAVSDKKVKSKDPSKVKSENSKNREANQMSKLLDQGDDQLLPEIPELDEILQLPKNIREEAFVRAVCTAHKAKLKSKKKIKQNLAWLHTESEN